MSDIIDLKELLKPSPGNTLPGPKWQRDLQIRMAPPPEVQMLQRKDLDAFLAANWLWKRDFTLDDLQAVNNDPKADVAAKVVATYMTANFDTLQKVTQASKNGTISVADMELLVDAMEAQSDLKEYDSRGKDYLSSNWDKLDTDGDGRISATEISQRASQWQATPSELRTLEVINRRRQWIADAAPGLDGYAITKNDVQTFESKTALDSLIKERHRSIERTDRTNLLSGVLAVTAAGGALWFRTGTWGTFMAYHAGNAAGRAVGGWFVKDNIEADYNAISLPALNKLLDKG